MLEQIDSLLPDPGEEDLAVKEACYRGADDTYSGIATHSGIPQALHRGYSTIANALGRLQEKMQL